MDPILRWAGGKKRLLPVIKKVLPERWNTYHEPMVGGGALFFDVNPPKSVISDINPELINFYKVLKNETEILIGELLNLKASKEKYYYLRAQKPKDPLNRAVRFCYLNRLCWNGLYRVNKKGEFNVPAGNRFPEKMWEKKDLVNAAQVLKKAKISNSDIGKSINKIKRDDFVFLDPPYPRGSKGKKGFNRYSKDKFDEKDHERLSDMLSLINEKEAKFLLIISNKPWLSDLYVGGYKCTEITSSTTFSSDRNSRGKASELLIRNYN